MVEILTILYFFAGILAVIIMGVLVWIFWDKMFANKSSVDRAVNMNLYHISLAKKTVKESADEQHKDEKNIIATMEQLYASFGYMHEKGGQIYKYGQPFIALEIAVSNSDEKISFYISIPIKYEEGIIKQIYGFFPDASIIKIEDYNIFNPTGVSRGSYLMQTKTYALPIKTYKHLDIDPINTLVTAMSQLKEKGEGASIQIVVSPADKGVGQLGAKIAQEMAKGNNYDFAFIKSSRSKLFKNFLFFIDTIKGPNENKNNEPKPAISAQQQDMAKLLDEKANKPVFEINIRILVSANDVMRAGQILSQIENSFTQFGSPGNNVLSPVRPVGKALSGLFFDYSFRLFNKKQSMLLSTEELTSLFHFYTGFLEAPKMVFSRSANAAPPADLPSDGLVIGKNNYRGQGTLVRLRRDDRRRHLYIIGQTGTGKSGFMKEMLRQDIINGEGVCIIDPHGEFAESALSYVPKERMDDLIYFDPGNLDRPIGLNMLEYDQAHPEQKTFIINELLSIFDKLYNLKETGGPMFEQYFRNALHLVMDDPASGCTLMNVMRVFTDTEYRAYKLSKTLSITVKNFWKDQAEKAGGDAALQNIAPYIVSKFDVFVTNAYMRPIIGQEHSAFNFRDVMDNKKILLVNLSKGKLGDINANLLGLIIVGKILISALSRVDIPDENQRKDFYLYIDEFQNYSSNSISTILSEARKYRLSLIMAHQFIEQLNDDIKASVFGNVGSLVSFRVSADDGEFLSKQFAPTFTQADLINQENRHATVKLLLNGKTSPPFDINTIDYPPGNDELAKSLREYSALKYGKARDVIENEINISLTKKYGV
ncbi:MAG: hypothetical protein COU81_02190 [Candidatus Portnoybacteria bacterium CG10_big_fil_rev_8_21_14_0_10_36_7]|uniref:Uncharacterized protein n=1 Tax=Candidatus Portnoybacteria bacterium CG10_big_fil_rev_8_21_14_0_10_36_7 TaxID=1974812 RepID=A0A2M8KE13_9BACT|nr:MAG: hypothetical protein COU81_02190 [Candidatus Portnoybacteria bacterium CG10_big_fil_rev_8_21_14_0_10_36_7]